MAEKSKRMVVVGLFLLIVFVSFHSGSSAASQPPIKNKSTGRSMPGGNRFGSSVVFPVQGNVYPLGYYAVYMEIGNPPKRYDLDIDTGSDLTWVQCDAPCRGCTKPHHQLYKPNRNLVPCKDVLCTALHIPSNHHCEGKEDQCDYEVEYADHGSSLGVLVIDNFPLKLMNGSLFPSRLGFGCGYDLKNAGHTPSTAGVLGLANGKASILSQLRALGITRNVLGHCLSSRGGGFLSLGDELVPSSGISWTPMTHSPLDKHYSSGPAELLFGGKATGVKGLQLIFDSGSSYTYFSSQAYKTTLDLVRKEINGKTLKETKEDKTLPICWKGNKPFQKIQQVRDYFKPLQLSFPKAKSVQLVLQPEAYLIVTKHGNVCLGILNGTEVGLGDLNLIGDISMLDKMVIYDNEEQQIGWVSANCDRIPNVDRDFEGFCQPYAADFGILEETCTATSSEKPSI